MSAPDLKDAPHAAARERRAEIDMTWLDPLRLGMRAARLKRDRAAQSTPGVRFCELPDASIRVRVAGERSDERPTIVLVCDPPSVIEHYDRLVSLLAPSARVVCFEPPGFGFSVPKRGFRFSFDAYRSAIEQMLIELDEGSYLLAFSCVWAHIALQIAAREPERIAKLMLWQSPAWSDQVRWARHVDARNLLATPLVGQLACAFGARKIGIAWFRQAMAKDRYREFTPLLETAFEQGAFCCFGSLWQHFYDHAPPAVSVRQPTLVTWGAADRTHRHSDKLSIARQVPHAVWHAFFEHAGHSPELEDSPAFAAVLLDWWDQRGPSPRSG
ncbi:alpha/beta hydrolase [Burkholderia ubonensis]|uniref:alpha/beta fold hydrolase n=1 Tax=Burkholderia ubonensis TaxID=101571 RepID=UPI00075E9689|nr:alpha/beta hydrolase [Burkholderia ubonensis]KVG80215.1 alpha/beta hydrolase [Burkholderia ubonensis]